MLLAAIAIVASPGCGGLEECPEVAGRYLSESESEWDVIIELRVDGTGSILRQVWEPGGADRLVEETAEIVWGCRGGLVEITYGEVRDALAFDAELSMEVMGIDRDVPGLLRQPPEAEESLLHGRHFWEEMGWPKE